MRKTISLRSRLYFCFEKTCENWNVGQAGYFGDRLVGYVTHEATQNDRVAVRDSERRVTFAIRHSRVSGCCEALQLAVFRMQLSRHHAVWTDRRCRP